MSSTFLHNLHTHTLSWDTTRNKKDSSFVSAYGVAPVGEVCEFNVYAHNLLNGH
jgi:hypothetical protein